MNSGHIPVLLQEVVDGLALKKGDTILDATVGGGGHSEAICKALGGEAVIICLDEDDDAIARSRERLLKCGCSLMFFRTNFRMADEALSILGIRKIDRAVLDLGLSSFQLEESGRGFSFQRDEPLSMTFRKEGAALTAGDIVNTWDEENIATILSGYGEERHAKRIVEAIVTYRKGKSITTSGELAAIVESAVRRKGKIHPATKTFQALRIAVNDEYRALKEGLPKIFEKLALKGRIAVISFHSLEDRFVKGYFRDLKTSGRGIPVTKKPITPQDEEIRANPRSRSAKLRIVEKTRI